MFGFLPSNSFSKFFSIPFCATLAIQIIKNKNNYDASVRPSNPKDEEIFLILSIDILSSGLFVSMNAAPFVS